MTVRTPVYLDHHATTPLDPRVLEAMMPILQEHFGNPSSASHAYGWAAARCVELAREQVAALIDCEPGEIVFTSGATESCNLALKGVAERFPEAGHIVSSVLEHDAVERPLADLERRGWRVTRVPCDPGGLVDPDTIAAALCDDTVLVSLIAAQNEIGTVQPWGRVAGLCRERGVLFHTDAAQAAGRIPLAFAADGIDLRSGTLNVAGIVGFGEACRLAGAEREVRAAHLGRLAAELYAAVAAGVAAVRLNGASRPRLPGSLNLSFPGVDASGLIRALPVLALSTGSACSSGRPGPSRALSALGLDARTAAGSLRIGLGKDTTRDEALFAAARIVEAVHRLREAAATP